MARASLLGNILDGAIRPVAVGVGAVLSCPRCRWGPVDQGGIGLLEVRDIHTYYGASYVLQGVSLRVDKSQVVGILGRNGMGKTTLIRSIIGFTPPRTGQVLFKGNGGPWTLETVMDLFPRLRERAESRAGKLSGGEQQMLAIRRALMTNPDFLLMDEPTEGLPPLLVREVGRVIGDLKARGLSILLVEQNIPLALRVTDQVHVLSRGRIVHSCPPHALWENQEVKARYVGL
jgi:branched-chain amino acid transport system ATP-binding protein